MCEGASWGRSNAIDQLQELQTRVGGEAYRDMQEAFLLATDRIRELEAALEQANKGKGREIIRKLTGERDEALDRLEQAKAENVRLREALEFYADKENWIPRIQAYGPNTGPVQVTPIVIDNGETARRALEASHD